LTDFAAWPSFEIILPGLKNADSYGELAMFERSPASQVESVELPANVERRRAVRFRCQRRNVWRLFAAATSSGGTGTVGDISLTGLSLLVDAPLRPGMFLELSLIHDDESSPAQPVLVRVRRVTRQAEGNWLLGCSFVKQRTQADLNAWL
jgi:hypothetical protein